MLPNMAIVCGEKLGDRLEAPRLICGFNQFTTPEGDDDDDDDADSCVAVAA